MSDFFPRRHLLLASSTNPSTTNDPHPNPSKTDGKTRLLVSRRVHIISVPPLLAHYRWILHQFVPLKLRSVQVDGVSNPSCYISKFSKPLKITLRNPNARTKTLWPLLKFYIGVCTRKRHLDKVKSFGTLLSAMVASLYTLPLYFGG